MAEHQHHEHQEHQAKQVLSKSKMVLIGFLLIAAYFLFAEHRAHIVPFLPYLLILACPLMHIFMHGGHGGHGGHQHGNGDVGTNKKGES
ncbi:MAG TPA: hypothetical protein DHV59_15835 [Oxalobacteraceae bacterium]|nr:hypothetical protein [Oxalobacteraceae bacterium]